MIVFLFPGQSSADASMVARARAASPAAAIVAERARGVLGPALAARYLGDAVCLETNSDVQISLFIATQMHLAGLAAEGVVAIGSLGLSLGEYSHLVHIGALGFDAALRLVMARGAAYDASPRGIMVSITGPDEAEVEEAVRLAAGHGVAVVSNYNSPVQHVIAGDAAAVRAAAARLEDEHGAHAVEIESRVAMHSPLLDAAASQFAAHLQAAAWRTAVQPYLPNVAAALLERPAAADFVHSLTAHVNRPVFWRRSLELVARRHPGAAFVEVGPGRVLHNLLSKRWLDVPRFATDARTEADAAAHWRATVEALRDRS